MSAPEDHGPPIDLPGFGFETQRHHDEQQSLNQGESNDGAVQDALIDDGLHPLFASQNLQQLAPSSIHPDSTSYTHLAAAGTANSNARQDPLRPPPSKKPRRRYDNNFKAEILQRLKIPGVRLPAVAKQFHIPENTVREWTKPSSMQAIEAARAKNSGQLKANVLDPMHRITKSLKEFFEDNERQPQHIRQPVTTKLVVSKGREAKKNLLELDRIKPFLDPAERKALNKFTSSDSWAKKFAKRHNLKMTGTRIKDLSEEELRQFHDSLKQMAARVKQAGPRYEGITDLLRQAGEKLWLARSAMGYHDSNVMERNSNGPPLSTLTNQTTSSTDEHGIAPLAPNTPHVPQHEHTQQAHQEYNQGYLQQTNEQNSNEHHPSQQELPSLG